MPVHRYHLLARLSAALDEVLASQREITESGSASVSQAVAISPRPSAAPSASPRRRCAVARRPARNRARFRQRPECPAPNIGDMYDHIGLKVEDLDVAVRFYRAALEPLG